MKKYLWIALWFVSVGIASAIAAEPELISVKQGAHASVPADSLRPAISGDGNVIAFESLARLTADDKNKISDVYVYDRRKKVLRLLHTVDSKHLNAGAALSADGKVVAFHSTPKPIRSNVSPRSADIYWQKIDEWNPLLITHAADGGAHDGEALFPRLNESGERLVFSSNGNDLIAGTTTTIREIYTFNQSADEFRMVSRATDGTPANRMCAYPRMSDDGRTVAFLSAATNLATPLPADSLDFHLYLHDAADGVNMRVDEFDKGFTPQEWIVGAFDMDTSGNLLVFQARRRDLVDPFRGLNQFNLFVYERAIDKVKMLTSGMFANKSHSPSISGDGRFVAFVLDPGGAKGDKGGLVVYDRERDTFRRLAEGLCSSPAISKDGRVIAYVLKDKKAKNIYAVSNPFLEETDAGH